MASAYGSAFSGRVARLAERPVLALVALIAAGLACYSPALNGERIWDDIYLVGENPFFRSPVFLWEVFRHWLFVDSYSTYYRPVQNWSYIFDYWLWGGDTLGYHLTNVLLHSCCGFLLYLLLRRILPREDGESRTEGAVAFLVSLAWTVHPMHNAAVAYIAGRADSLAGVFACSAWLMALRARAASVGGVRIAIAVLACGLALLAVCAKEIALVWLAIYAMHAWFFDREASRRAKVAALAAGFAVVAAYAFLHALPVRPPAMERAPVAPLAGRALMMVQALGDYTRLIAFPTKLYMERSLAEGRVYLAMLGGVAAIAAAMLWRSKAPGQGLRRLGCAWFAAGFLPISNLFPLNAQVAEHWIYLASVGALLFVAGCALALPRRWHARLAAAAALCICALAARTAVRAGDWADAETFCRRTIADGGVTPRILGMLAWVYKEREDFPRQEELLRKTLAVYPTSTPARIQLGICLQKQGRAAEAAAFLEFSKPEAEASARQVPRAWQAALQLARMRAEERRLAEAVAILREARGRFPEEWELLKCEAEITAGTAESAGVAGAVERFVAAHWWHQDAWLTLASLRWESGQGEPAIAALRHAARLDIHDARPLAGIARIELARGRGEAALEAQRAAIARQPGQAVRYLALADMLTQLGRGQEAAAAVRQARSLAAAKDS